MGPLDFLVVSLVTYRVSQMVAMEEGPFALFEKFRNLFLKDDWAGRGVRCPKCLSFWFGLGVSFLFCYSKGGAGFDWIFYGLAASGATLVIMRYWAR